VFPELYNWVTFGVTSLMEMMFKQESGTLQKGQSVSPYRKEFCAALERTAAYAHTGNTKVLSRAVMGPLFIIRGLIEHGMPTIKKDAYQTPVQNATPLIVHAGTWPLSRSRRYPAMCTKTSMVLNYGHEHYMVSRLINWTRDRVSVECDTRPRNGPVRYAG
jgi:hypothetical protein